MLALGAEDWKRTLASTWHSCWKGLPEACGSAGKESLLATPGPTAAHGAPFSNSGKHRDLLSLKAVGAPDDLANGEPLDCTSPVGTRVQCLVVFM